jgi:hypothetical protein
MEVTKNLRSMVLFSAMVFVMLVGLFLSVRAEAKTVWGKTIELGKGTARSFVEMNVQGQPVSLGIVFTGHALVGLPTEPEPPETMLELPAQAAVPPFKYIAINWNPKGHEPKMYELPHFDFHFYIIPDEERNKITTDNTAQFAKAPPAQDMPADYMQAPGGVPRMGAHWVDKTAPELQGKPFTATFIYGTYDGKIAFYEPMVAMAFLKSKPNFTATIKQPAAYEITGFYPTNYRINYDKKHGEYRIILEGLTKH